MIPKILIGDIFNSKHSTLVNTVNCVGVMGKGIAQEFKKRYPDMYRQYKIDCEHGRMKVGEPVFYTDLFGHSVVNFPTKNHWKSPSLLKDIEKGLDTFLKKYEQWGIKSIAFPPLGCGNGGLAWDDVGPLMYQKLSQLKIPVEIYAPYGTNPEKLKIEFLSVARNNQQKKGTYYQNSNTPGNLAALEVLHRLEQQRYTKPVGRTMFQKIYYVLTDLSVDTGLNFVKSSYGPFSKDLKQVLHVFANENLLHESQYDQMMKQTIGERYYDIRKEYSTELKKWEEQISKTVDLFSRIKDTDQAEEVTTILFSVKELQKDHTKATADEVINYIITWKKNWNNDIKKESIRDSIENLESLGWINIENTNLIGNEEHINSHRTI